jgi:hypothetical protein
MIWSTLRQTYCCDHLAIYIFIKDKQQMALILIDHRQFRPRGEIYSVINKLRYHVLLWTLKCTLGWIDMKRQSNTMKSSCVLKMYIRIGIKNSNINRNKTIVYLFLLPIHFLLTTRGIVSNAVLQRTDGGKPNLKWETK